MARNKKMKSSKNLNKWRKGDSSASNPGINKHRKLALERRFSLMKLENKKLTVEAVEAHTVGLTIADRGTLKADDVESVDFKSIKSCKTFATNFTTCTIPAFETFFEKYTKTSMCHNRMLSVHAVVQEEIKKSNLPETSTSYLCGLMKCFSSLNNEEDTDATLKLVSMVIKKANPAVLQECFGSYFEIFYDVFKKNEESKYVLANLFGCLSTLLRAQQPEEWSTVIIKHLIKKMLDYTVCEIPKIRHSAQYNLAAIMKGSCFMPDYNDEENTTFVQHPISLFIGEFILEELSNNVRMKNAKSTLHLLIFLKLCISTLPPKILEEICTKLLQVIHMGDTLVKKCSMEVIIALFKANVTSLNADQLSCIVRALSITGDRSKGLLLVPNINDSTICGVWMSVVTHGIVRIVRLDQDLGFRILTSWFEQLVYCWNSDHISIHDNVAENIDILLYECLAPLDKNEMAIREAEVEQILLTINKGLSFQCQTAWEFVFRSIASAIQVVGPHLPHAVTTSVKKVSEFSSEQHEAHWKCVNFTIGKAIESIGVEEVLKVLPIQITGSGTADGVNAWILPIIRDHVTNDSLRFFRDYFVPLADKCREVVKSLKRDRDNERKLTSSADDESFNKVLKEYETIELQMWGLFPKIAKGANDQEEFLFPAKHLRAEAIEFCKRLCRDIIAREDIRMDILLGLRNMIKNCPTENPGKLADFAKNYIPVMFNLFLTKPKSMATEEEPGILGKHRLEAKNAAALFFRIAPVNVLEDNFEAVINKLTTNKPDGYQKRFMVILLKEFVPFLSTENIQKTYNIIDKYLPKKKKIGKDSAMQKSAYRVLEKILQTKTEACCDFASSKFLQIVDLLRCEPVKQAIPSKINIMHMILENLPTVCKSSVKRNFIKLSIENAVNYCQRKYCRNARNAAYRLLFYVGPALEKLCGLSTEESLREVCHRIRDCTVTPHTDSESTIATKIDIIKAILMKYQEIVDHDLMGDVMGEVLEDLTVTSAMISSASLTFLSQVFRFWPVSFMSDFVENTILKLSEMDQRCREVKHRQQVRLLLCRLMRKFGAERVKVAIPEGKNNDVMRKVLKNLTTLEAQKSKERVKRDKHDNEQEMSEDEDITPASGLDAILQELDIDLEEGNKPNKSKKILKKPQLRIIEGGEDNITDLLDPASVFTRARKVRFAPEEPSRQAPATAGFRIDAVSGKFIIEEESNATKVKRDNEEYCNKMIAKDSLFGSAQKRKLTTNDDDSDEEINNAPSIKRQKLTKKQSFGSEFKAKRAGGDLKKGGVQPYAYLKLDRRMLNRRLHTRQVGQFTGIVKKGIRQAPRKVHTT